MIDFSNAEYLKLRPVDNATFHAEVAPLMIVGESIVATFQTVRDGLMFTNKRIMAINVQGIRGKKKDFTSLPYSKVQAFSVETAGTFDLDSELELWFSGLGKVRFEFTTKADVAAICRMISGFVLGEVPAALGAGVPVTHAPAGAAPPAQAPVAVVAPSQGPPPAPPSPQGLPTPPPPGI